jgi:hypothetical protein
MAGTSLALALIASAASAAASAPPTTAANAAFARYLVHRFGVSGYHVCPPAQADAGYAYCTAELSSAGTRHLIIVKLKLAAPAAVSVVNDQHWRRHWAPLSQASLGLFQTPGAASVNSSERAFDWGFIVHAMSVPPYRHSFTVDGYDGQGSGLMRFYLFHCHAASPPAATCTNAFGDAIRYTTA